MEKQAHEIAILLTLSNSTELHPILSGIGPTSSLASSCQSKAAFFSFLGVMPQQLSKFIFSFYSISSKTQDSNEDAQFSFKETKKGPQSTYIFLEHGFGES